MAKMAYDAEVDGIYYNVVSNIRIAAVTSGDNPYTGEVVIPETFVYQGKTYTVMSVGDYAFNGILQATAPERIKRQSLFKH